MAVEAEILPGFGHNSVLWRKHVRVSLSWVRIENSGDDSPGERECVGPTWGADI